MTDFTVIESYDLYLGYLENLRRFYNVINNTQYQTRITENGDYYYKEVTEKKWNRIVPPKFILKEDIIVNLENERQKILSQIQDIQMSLFMGNANLITENDIVNYNQMVAKENQLTDKINEINQYDIEDIQSVILSETKKRNEISEKLTQMMNERQKYYTFDGETMNEYNNWLKNWKLTSDYTEWKKINSKYHKNLQSLIEIKDKIIKNNELQDNLIEFMAYDMISNPTFENKAAEPKASNSLIKIKSDVPDISQINLPKNQPIKITKKPCKSDAKQASVPNYVCNPASGRWVGVNTDKGIEIMQNNPFDQLNFSAKTNTTNLKQKIADLKKLKISDETKIVPKPEVPEVPEPEVPEPEVSDKQNNVPKPEGSDKAKKVTEPKISNKPKHTIGLKNECDLTAPKAKLPGHVCNPITKNWVLVT